MNSKNDNNESINKTNQNCSHSLELLKRGKIKEARIIFEEIFKNDYTNFIAESGIKCSRFWDDRIDSLKDSKFEPIEKAEYFFNEWIKFENFFNLINRLDLTVKNNISFFIFNTIIDLIINDNRFNENTFPDLYLILGISYKKIGDFNNSIKYLKDALTYSTDDANILSQLADCYALLNEHKKAKLLFREAFFKDPTKVNLVLLDSNIITDILTIIKEFSIEENEIPYWIPVYGRVFKLLDACRELLNIELNSLRADILKLENRFKNDKDNITKSRLLNHYLWLYDYYFFYKKDKNEIEEIDQKIKNISLPIYNIFKNKSQI
jgi:tetratricopeptide (TPR) repeat protein